MLAKDTLAQGHMIIACRIIFFLFLGSAVGLTKENKVNDNTPLFGFPFELKVGNGPFSCASSWYGMLLLFRVLMDRK